MIGAFIRHGALSSKVRVLYGKRLSNDDMNEMLKKRSVGDIASFLKETPSYSDALSGINEKLVHRGQLESILKKTLFEEYIKVYKFAYENDKTFLKTILIKYEIEQILSFVRFLRAGQPEEFIYSIPEFIIDTSKVDFAKISKCNNFDSLLESLRDTPYYEVLSKYKGSSNLNYSDIESLLFSFYFTLILKKMLPRFSGTIREDLRRTIGSQIDLINIIRIIRLKEYYNLDANEIDAFLIPLYYKINLEIIEEIKNSKNADEAKEMLKKTPYSKLFSEHKVSYLEQYEFELIYHISKAAMRNGIPSVNVPVAYFNLKEIEIKNIIAIIEGKRYNMSYDDIKKHLIGIS